MENRTGKNFLENTKYEKMGISDQMKGVQPPPLELEPNPSKPTKDLPEQESLEPLPTTIQEAINNRQSLRQYSNMPLKMKELAFLLWSTQGVKQVIPKYATLRTVPSAGARHALETYLLINRIEGLTQGLYHFLATDFQLQEVEQGEGLATALTDACFGQKYVRESAVTFIWVADHYRMTWRYGDRGYRYIFLDAGHVCQNLYLAAEAVGCGVCAIAAFSDDRINEILHLDGDEQFVIYIATLGKK